MKLPGRLIRGQVRPDRRTLANFVSLRWAALPIIDRRWTGPLAGAALGMGLFVGVAIGPGTQGSEATSALTVQVPPTADETTTTADAGHGEQRGGAHEDGDGGAGDGGGGAGAGGGGGSPSPTPSPPLDTSGSTPPITNPPISPTPSTPIPSGGVPSTSTTTPADTTEPTTELAGTVVHINPHAESYTIASDGNLTAIHSHRPPNLGKSIEVDAERLPNGTYAEAGNRSEDGSNGQATFGGTVSFSDPKHDTYTVSAPGVSLLVRGNDGHVPRLGDIVEVRARIADNAEPLPVRSAGEEGCGDAPPRPKEPGKALEQVSLRIESEASSTPVEGIVEGVCRDSRRLIVSADDLRESGRDISLLVPKDIDLGKLKTGQVLRLTAAILDGGSLQLSTVAGDRGGKGAQDTDLVQP